MLLVQMKTNIIAYYPFFFQQYYNLMPWKETMKLAPELRLDKVVKTLCPEGYDFENNLIITSFPEYLTNMSEIIQNTEKEALQDFFLWQAVSAFAFNVEADEIMPYKDFRRKLHGIVSNFLAWPSYYDPYLTDNLPTESWCLA